MSKVRLYAATSLDGFVADADGDTAWLEPYQDRLFAETGFMSEIGAVILGRRTFEFMQAFAEWPYAGKRAYILTTQAPWNLPDNAVFVRNGGIAAAVQAAREDTRKDIWIVGGALTMQSAIDAGLVDIIEICVVPVLLGRGLPMLNSLSRRRTLAFDGMAVFGDDIVKLRYATLRGA
ncbi:MAG: dihydrofolate reductase family protein [Hyphomicrobiaceae bacterium]|nr:dihydrofolate reductase family protein [Hyphomicrobiaceae bacterium]